MGKETKKNKDSEKQNDSKLSSEFNVKEMRNAVLAYIGQEQENKKTRKQKNKKTSLNSSISTRSLPIEAEKQLERITSDAMKPAALQKAVDVQEVDKVLVKKLVDDSKTRKQQNNKTIKPAFAKLRRGKQESKKTKKPVSTGGSARLARVSSVRLGSARHACQRVKKEGARDIIVSLKRYVKINKSKRKRGKKTFLKLVFVVMGLLILFMLFLSIVFYINDAIIRKL